MKGGNGLNMVEVASVEPLSSPSSSFPLRRICISGAEKLTDAIHEAGGKAGIQLLAGKYRREL
ncbi:MAG: hypothetical protein ACLUOI_22220 [Eisenbergiella sp.]